MPADIGAKVTLQGEKQYREQMRQITQQTKLMRTETQQLEASFGKGTTSMQKAAQQTELLKAQIAQQSQTVETARANVERYSQATGENSSQTLKWKNVLAQAELELTKLQEELAAVPNSIQIMGQRMQETGQKIQSAGKVMTSVGSTLTKTVTAPIAAIGVASIKTTADFDESMSKVQALSGATGKDFDALRNKAREMGASTKYSAGESADALSYMALAGWDTNQMLDGLDGVMNLAAASGMDLAEASDIVTDYLSAFGLEAKDASKMADQMAYAQAHSNTTTTQLGEAFGNSAARMHTAGQSMETTTALLEAFANQGTKGSEAGTQLAATMRDIGNKMKDGKIQIGETSIAVQDQNGNFRNLIDILADVESATEGMGTAEKQAALQTVFTRNSYNAVSQALTEGTSNIKQYERALYGADGTAKSMADTMQNNLKGQLTILRSQVQELGISFGDILVPYVQKAVDWVQDLVDKFNRLDSGTKEQIAKFAALAASIGPVLLIGGKLTTGIGKLVEGGGKALEWIGKTIPGMSGLVAAVGPVATAFGLAAGAGALLGFAVKELNEKYGNETSHINEFNQYVLGTADAADTAREHVNQSTKALRDTSEDAARIMEEAGAAAELTDRYAEELYDLAGKTNRTAEEQRRLEAIVEILNQMYPGFTQDVMDANGQLKMGVGELKDYVQGLKDVARTKALQGIIEEYTAKIVEAEKRQIEAEHALADAQDAAAAAGKEREKVVQTQAGTQDRATAAYQKYQQTLMSGTATIEEITAAEQEYRQAQAEVANGYIDIDGEATSAASAIATYSDAETIASGEAERLNKAVQEQQAEVDKTSKEADEYRQELEDIEKAVDGYTGSTEDATSATGEYGEEVGETSEALGEFEDEAEDAGDAAEDFAKKVQEAWSSAYDSAYDSATKQTDLFGTLAETTDISTEEMIKNLQSHVDSMRNWNSNVSRLTNDTRYKTDENFRAIVDYLITNTDAADGQLDQFVKIFEDGGEDLDTILAGYSEYINELGPEYAKGLADATVSADYGLSNIESTFDKKLSTMRSIAENNGNGVIRAVAQALADKEGTVINTATKAWSLFGKSTSKTATQTGKAVTGSYNDAVESEGKKLSFKSLLKSAVSGYTELAKQATAAKAAGEAVAKAAALGIESGGASVTVATEALRVKMVQSISQIQNLRSSANTAGSSVASGLQAGIRNGSSGVSSAINTIRSTIITGVSAIGAQKATAQTAGDSIGSSLASGISGKEGTVRSASQKIANAAKTPLQTLGNSSDPSSWGRHVGDNFANGVGGASGNATANGNKVANAARNALKAADNNDPWTWGRHMGDNFANGIGSAYGNVLAQARKLANAVTNILQHSTPKEGPLRDDDVWGLHLGQNFARGMMQAVPLVESAAMTMADAVALPTSTMLDIDAVSGRSVAADALTLEGLHSVIEDAVGGREIVVQIGKREFARLLREQGAIA